jgi:hypothetical protein
MRLLTVADAKKDECLAENLFGGLKEPYIIYVTSQITLPIADRKYWNKENGSYWLSARKEKKTYYWHLASGSKKKVIFDVYYEDEGSEDLCLLFKFDSSSDDLEGRNCTSDNHFICEVIYSIYMTTDRISFGE